VANALGELLGLGAVAAAGYLFAGHVGEPRGAIATLSFALVLTAAGAFEGYAVGYAQSRVLRLRIPTLAGWTKATIVGAVVAWAAGMVPGTVMNLTESPTSAQPPVIGEGVRLLLAAGLGLVAGPILAFFQWRVLRNHLPGAIWWLPANALAWALSMPVIFLGVHIAAAAAEPASAIVAAAATIAAAGAVVGAIHGAFLLWLFPRDHAPRNTGLTGHDARVHPE